MGGVGGGDTRGDGILMAVGRAGRDLGLSGVRRGLGFREGISSCVWSFCSRESACSVGMLRKPRSSGR